MGTETVWLQLVRYSRSKYFIPPATCYIQSHLSSFNPSYSIQSEQCTSMHINSMLPLHIILPSSKRHRWKLQWIYIPNSNTPWLWVLCINGISWRHCNETRYWNKWFWIMHQSMLWLSLLLFMFGGEWM